MVVGFVRRGYCPKKVQRWVRVFRNNDSLDILLCGWAAPLSCERKTARCSWQGILDRLAGDASGNGGRSTSSFPVSVHALKNNLAADHCHPNFRLSDFFVSDGENILGQNGEVRFFPGLQGAKPVFGKPREG